VLQLFPGRVPGAAHSGWAEPYGSQDEGSEQQIEIGGLTISRPKLTALRAAAEQMGIDMKSMARAEDLEAL